MCKLWATRDGGTGLWSKPISCQVTHTPRVTQQISVCECVYGVRRVLQFILWISLPLDCFVYPRYTHEMPTSCPRRWFPSFISSSSAQSTVGLSFQLQKKCCCFELWSKPSHCFGNKQPSSPAVEQLSSWTSKWQANELFPWGMCLSSASPVSWFPPETFASLAAKSKRLISTIYFNMNK